MRLEKLLCTHVQNILGVIGNSKLGKKKDKKKKRSKLWLSLHIEM